MFINVDWSERDAHMFDGHGITTWEAEEALSDPERIVISPDYASRSSCSHRIIGYAASRSQILAIIVVVDPETGIEYGASGWVANTKDRLIYAGKGGENEQDL